MSTIPIPQPVPSSSYDYIHQDIVATALILPTENDSFYNPVANLHTGFAFDGRLYRAGVPIASGSPPTYTHATWWTEYTSLPNPYRGDQANFPATGLLLLSPVSLTILDQSNQALPMWMQFLLCDSFMFANDFSTGNSNYPNPLLNGWNPSGVTYADGIVSVIYTPDIGAYSVDAEAAGSPPSLVGPFTIQPGAVGSGPNMVLSIDFSHDWAYLDVPVAS
jgi:hypothetical protein